MTESEWLRSTDPAPMLALLEGRVGDRKLRLFACSCCRGLWSRLSSEEQAVVHALEEVADGPLPRVGVPAEYQPNHTPSFHTAETLSASAVSEAAAPSAWHAAKRSRAFVVDARRKLVGQLGRAEEWQRQADLMRCIVGNPFRPITLDPSLRTSTVVALAKQMYDTRDFAAAPILADALQDAGCEDATILNHLRANTVHVRGCFVIDAILGKE